MLASRLDAGEGGLSIETIEVQQGAVDCFGFLNAIAWHRMHKTVLLVEDEMLVALDLEDLIRQAGFDVYGPYATVVEACGALGQARPDCAVLDVRLRDGEVFPAADLLKEADVPIIFHSGHADPRLLAERYPGAVICSKPCSPENLKSALKTLCER